ncbi:Replication protein A DNA-binding subunit E [Glycine max]|nr:Replication protein A DNA-binding subunit E [Glycine max]
MDLKENCTYVMHNFKVLKNNGQYRVCDHQFKLVFIEVTVVRQCALDDLPFRKYRFAEFGDVVARQFELGLLVDVIGVVDEVVFRHVSGKGRRVVFKLKDLSQQLLSCTLWDDYCLQFLKFLDDHEGHGPITVLLTHGRIKEAQGSYPPSVNNSFKASKLAELGIEARSVFKSHGSIQLSSKESFFGKAEAKTIVEINTIPEEIVCVTIGTITRIVMDNHSWCYIACIQCHKKIDAEMMPFTCACGKYNQEAMLRYRLDVMINHRDENTKFLLWDRECTELIGQSADAINRLKIEDGDFDLNVSPQALDKLLGYVLAFKIKVQPKFRNSAILKCSIDSSLIDVVMDMLPDAETSSKINVPAFDSNHSTKHESKSMSVTIDHDPLLGLPLTPTKRQTFHDCDDEATSSLISPAQLSSNKLKKHDSI